MAVFTASRTRADSFDITPRLAAALSAGHAHAAPVTCVPRGHNPAMEKTPDEREADGRKGRGERGARTAERAHDRHTEGIEQAAKAVIEGGYHAEDGPPGQWRRCGLRPRVHR